MQQWKILKNKTRYQKKKHARKTASRKYSTNLNDAYLLGEKKVESWILNIENWRGIDIITNADEYGNNPVYHCISQNGSTTYENFKFPSKSFILSFWLRVVCYRFKRLMDLFLHTTMFRGALRWLWHMRKWIYGDKYDEIETKRVFNDFFSLFFVMTWFKWKKRNGMRKYLTPTNNNKPSIIRRVDVDNFLNTHEIFFFTFFQKDDRCGEFSRLANAINGHIDDLWSVEHKTHVQSQSPFINH